MKGKIVHILLLFNSVLLHFGTGEALITVNGIVNGSVTLPSGSPYTSPSKVRWMIDNSVIAVYLAPSFVQMETKRFGDRLRLNTTDGSLQINRAQMGDADTYTVAVSQGESKHNAVVKLMIYERADTPILEVLTNTSGPRFCNVSVRCSTLYGLWVESLCQLTQGKLMCQETARNDFANSTRLLITATRDAINCSSSSPASASSAPLLPVTQVCSAPVPGSPSLLLCALISVLSSLGLVAMVSAVIAVNARERCCRDQWGLRKEDESVRVVERIPI